MTITIAWVGVLGWRSMNPPVHERRGNLAVKYFKYTNKIEGEKNPLLPQMNSYSYPGAMKKEYKEYPLQPQFYRSSVRKNISSFYSGTVSIFRYYIRLTLALSCMSQ